MTNIKNKSCPNKKCTLFQKQDHDNIRKHGWYKTKLSKRRRYKCNACGKSFSSTHSTAYYRLRASRKEIDQACQMSAEGVSISFVGRILKHEWNTIDRWQERARNACHDFQEKHMRGYNINEVQADEIKTFIGPRKRTTWIMATIEVTFRLWTAVGVGSRSYKNIRELFAKAFHKGILVSRS